MPEMNWLAIIVASLVPMVLGAIYYGPLLGKQWFSSLGKTAEEMEPNNPAVTYGLALLMAFLAATSIWMNIEMTHKDVNSAGELVFGSFHTFKHGALHGAMLALTTVIPIIVSLSLFHKMSGKNILLNIVFWTLCFTLMGGILDAWQ